MNNEYRLAWSAITRDDRGSMQIVVDLQGQDVALNKYRKFARRVSFIVVLTIKLSFQRCIFFTKRVTYMATRFL